MADGIVFSWIVQAGPLSFSTAAGWTQASSDKILLKSKSLSVIYASNASGNRAETDFHPGFMFCKDEYE